MFSEMAIYRHSAGFWYDRAIYEWLREAQSLRLKRLFSRF